MKLFIILTYLVIYSPIFSFGYNEALNKFKNNNIDESLQIIRKIHEENKQTVETHYLAGHIYLKKGNRTSVIAHWSEALKLDPGNEQISTDLAKYYIKTQSYKECFKVIENALTFHPNSLNLLLIKSTAFLYSENYTAALTIIEKLKSENPNNYHPLALEGELYFLFGKYEKSELSLKWAISLNPSNFSLYNNLGLVYEKLSSLEYDKKNQKKSKEYILESKTNFIKAAELNKANVQVKKNFERVQLTLNEKFK